MTTLNNVERFWSLVDKQDGSKNSCWLWLGGERGGGYGGFRERKNPQMFYAHKYAFFQGRNRRYVPSARFRFICENKKCVNPFHLKAFFKPQGGRKIPLDKIRAIRYTYDRLQKEFKRLTLESGVKLTDILLGGRLSRKFGVSRVTVHNIVTRKGIYKDIE